MNRTAVLGACAAAALAAYLAMGLAFIRASAPTYDEAVHLASGYSYLATGKYVLNISDHPPLAEMAAALPLLALKPSLPADPSSVEKSRLYDYGAAFLYRNSVPAGRDGVPVEEGRAVIVEPGLFHRRRVGRQRRLQRQQRQRGRHLGQRRMV